MSPEQIDEVEEIILKVFRRENIDVSKRLELKEAILQEMKMHLAGTRCSRCNGSGIEP